MSFYDDASWVLIPSGIKEDVIYAQKPSSGLGDLTMTRASDATYTDASGVVRRSPYNLLQFSEQFDNAAWSKTGITVTPNVEIAPNGTLTADRVVFGFSNRALSSSTSLGTGVVCTGSFYVKGTAGETLLMAAGGLDQLFTLNGSWQRISTTKTSINSIINVSTFGGATARDIFLWGAQLVEGTEALDYFPTTNRQDVPRIDFRNADGTLSSCGRLLLEPQRTNSIRNSSMVGAVAGTPGTLPTNWAAALNGLTQTVVGTGTENGLPYIDLRFNGTATSTIANLQFEGASVIPASNSQGWTNSFYLKTIATPQPPISLSLLTIQRASGASVGSFALPFAATGSLTRYTQTITTNQPTITNIQPLISFTLTNGQTYDFTIRIAAPQMELGNFASTWVPTTTAAVTRLADAARTAVGATSLFASQWTAFGELVIPARGTTGTAAGYGFRSVYGSTTLANWPFYVIHGTTTGTLDFQWVVSGSIAKIATVSITYGTRFKFSATSDGTLYINGTLSSASSSLTPATPVEFGFGRLGQSDFSAGESVAHNQAALFPTRLDNATLAQLTTL